MGIDLTKVTNKTLSNFEDLEPSYEAKLEFFDAKKNHNKFWHIRVYDRHVVRHYGRHGSKGQVTIHRAYNEWGAKKATRDLEDKKRDKGYKTDDTTILDHIARRV